MPTKIFYKFNGLALARAVLAALFALTVSVGNQNLMAQTRHTTIPPEFVNLQETVLGIHLEVRYFSEDNFVGSRIEGYYAEKIFITRPAANALSKVQEELANFGLSLKVFDAYRPQSAVNHFVKWAKDLDDTKMKQIYYPKVDKENLFRDGYIAERSGHSRGSTIDLTIVDLVNGEELDMGSDWDFFDPISWPSSSEVSTQSRANRKLLASVMSRHGFKALPEEWWHFTLVDELFADTYFDFPIE